jgi:hypothetical protein
VKPDTLEYALYAPRCEPVKRLHGEYKHHFHRFAIKGGITPMEVWRKELVANLLRENSLLKLLKARSKK